MSDAKLKQRVAKYARRLDEADPEWFRKIVLTRLDMAGGMCNPDDRWPCGCIGAQLDWHFQRTKPRHRRKYADWMRGLRRLGIHSTRAFAGSDWGELDRLWTREVQQRRAAS